MLALPPAPLGPSPAASKAQLKTHLSPKQTPPLIQFQHILFISLIRTLHLTNTESSWHLRKDSRRPRNSQGKGILRRQSSLFPPSSPYFTIVTDIIKVSMPG